MVERVRDLVKKIGACLRSRERKQALRGGYDGAWYAKSFTNDMYKLLKYVTDPR